MVCLGVFEIDKIKSQHDLLIVVVTWLLQSMDWLEIKKKRCLACESLTLFAIALLDSLDVHTSWLSTATCFKSIKSAFVELFPFNASFFSCFLSFISGTGFLSSGAGSLLEDGSMTTLVCSTSLLSSKQTSWNSKIWLEGWWIRI